MSVDILGTSWDQCQSMVQYSFMSTETRRLVSQPRTATSTLTQLLNYDVDVKHHVYLYACWSPTWQTHVWLLWLFMQKHLAICAQIFGLLFPALQLRSDGSYCIHWCSRWAIKTSVCLSSVVAISSSLVRRPWCLASNSGWQPSPCW